MSNMRRPDVLVARGAALGGRIARLRLAADLTQAQLAARSGVGVHALVKLEQGRIASPGVFAVADLAAALNVSLDRLVAEERRPVASLGYEGRDLESFLAEVTAAGIRCVADVRLTPISRKRGFSKSRLRDALAEVGVEYVHYPHLGNPKDNRAYFTGSGLAVGRSRYKALLHRPESQIALADLAKRSQAENMALLCFEADDTRCHRSVVLEELAHLG